MTTACLALREIQLGHLGMKQFAPPEVFTSRLYQRFKVTIADLRRHVLDCAVCAQGMDETRVQLRHFDIEQLRNLHNGLSLMEESIAQGLRLEERRAEETAADVAKGFLADSPGRETGWALEDIVEQITTSEERRQAVYLGAIKMSAIFSLLIERWLETALPPAVPRIWLDKSGQGQDVQIDWNKCETDQSVALSSELMALAGSESAVGLLLRTLYLREAFGRLVTDQIIRSDSVLTSWGQTRLTVPVSQRAGPESDLAADWEKVWQHYSLLAGLRASQVSECAVLTASASSPEVSEAFKKLVELQEQVLDKVEALYEGQTAMMGVLLETFHRAPEETKRRCQETICAALGSIFDDLTEESRSFLLASEYAYEVFPADLDHSQVIVGFTKAFESELRTVTAPVLLRMQEVTKSDPNWKWGKNLNRAPLGAWDYLLDHHHQNLKGPFAGVGLDCTALLNAIRKINQYKGAKHSAPTDKATATSFRALFLGGSSVLWELRPKRA